MLTWVTRNISNPSPNGSELQPVVAPPVIPEQVPSPHDPTHLDVAPPAAAGAPPAATALTPEQPRKNIFTAALNTPHDAVLAELHGHHDPSARTDATPSTSALGMQSIDTLPAAASDAPGSVATSSSPPPEFLYEPFTGATMGILSPTSSTKKGSEDLWAHLARIRSLQADVARLHLTMEGIGLGDSVAPHLLSTMPRAAVGERLEDDENSDGDGGSEAEKRREREFERSERRFDGRKEETEQIMAKLDELSQALAAFHVLDTPMFNSAAAPASTLSSTPVPHRPDLHRISLAASSRGREENFDSPGSIQGPLPVFEESESRVGPAQADASVPRHD